MNKPMRIQRKRTKGWRKPEGAVYVGRGSKWGNPWRVLRGNTIGPNWFEFKALAMDAKVPTLAVEDSVVFSTHAPATEAATHTTDLFRNYCEVMRRDHRHEFTAWIHPLKNKDLMCWCLLDQPCHADVLLELANPAPNGDER